MSGYKRFFVDKIEKETILCGEEFIHAKSVLRLNEGDEIILLDNSGKEYNAIISKINKNDMLCNVISENDADRECKNNIKLICGALKGDKTELIIQKATELGVKQIAVFNSKFCNAFFNENKLERLNKVAKESAKQCMRGIYPKITYYNDFKSALLSAENYKNKLFACEFAIKNEVDFNLLKGDTAVVVGSEGGFAEEEFELAKSLNFSTIYLGKRILRAETACIALCSIIANALGELQ